MNRLPLSIIAIGESMIELADAGDQVASWTYAGDVLNWAVAFSDALPDSNVQHLCAIGDDNRSAGFTTFCTSLGVEVSESAVLPGRNMGIYWISTVNGDRRFRYWRAESAAREQLRSGARILPGQPRDVVMFSNITLAVAGDCAQSLLAEIADARAKGTTVVYDTNYRPPLWSDMSSTRSLESRAFDLADYVHASMDDVCSVWGESLMDFVARLERAGVNEAVITDGAGDVVVAELGVTRTIRPRVVEPVDTSGAGDAFFGTYVGRRLASDAVDEAVAAAAEVCARVVQHHGALTYRTAGTSGSPLTPG